MKYKLYLFRLAILSLFFLSTSCGNQRYLKSHSESAEKPRKRIFDEQMVIKNKINFEKQNYKIEEDSETLWYELASIIRQTPDVSIVKGFRQWVYHLNDSLSVIYRYNKDSIAILPDTIRRKNTGMRKWLHTKVGAAPVILDSALTKKTAESMQHYLHQKAYFNAKVTYNIQKIKHKAFVTYNVNTGMPLLVDSVQWFSKDSLLNEIVNDIKGLTVLKQGTPLSLNSLNDEKRRLTLAIRNRGYYDFNWNYIVAEADTVNAKKYTAQKPKLFSSEMEQGEPRAKVYVEIMPFSDTTISHPKYKICNVYITPNEVILKAHQKRVIKKDSFFVVERIIKDRKKNSFT